MNWKNWLRGLVSAAIGAGATALAGASVKPDGVGMSFVWKLAGVNALVAAAMYLKQSPLPDSVDVPVTGPTGRPLLWFWIIVPFWLCGAGCTHFDVQQTFYDADAQCTVTNRARGTLFFARNTLEKIDLASRTKTTSTLVRGKGIESSGDSEAIKALAGALGEVAGMAAKTAVKP